MDEDDEQKVGDTRSDRADVCRAVCWNSSPHAGGEACATSCRFRSWFPRFRPASGTSMTRLQEDLGGLALPHKLTPELAGAYVL